jgi:hypothetical protein
MGTAIAVLMTRLDRSDVHCENHEMERTIDVGSNYREWWFVTLVGVTVALVAGGGVMLGARAEGGIPVLAAGVVAAVASSLAAVAIAKRRFSVRITPFGFVVHNRHGEREFTDEQVICASLYSTSNYSNGDWQSTTRVFDLWVEAKDHPERFKMVNRILLGAADPLEMLIERIVGHLCDRADAALAAKQPFEGENWALHNNELVVAIRRTTKAVRFDEIAALDVFDDHLCLWKQGEVEPTIRIPARSANTAVLQRLLRDRLPESSESDAPLGVDRLGRILFERKPGRLLTVVVWLLPISACGLFAAAALTAVVDGQIEPLLIGGALSMALGLLWLVPLSQCARLRCHERGIARRWLRWEKRLPFRDVDSFSYSAVKQYVKGIYWGTTFTLTFVAKRDGKPVTITYARTLRNADEELDHLRDHASRVIAARMAEEFGRGNAVSWTTGLKFLSDGLEYRASGFLGRKGPVLIAYDRIAGVDVTDGHFQMWVAGQKKPLVKESVSQPNFFPGYTFLVRLMVTHRSLRLNETVRGA